MKYTLSKLFTLCTIVFFLSCTSNELTVLEIIQTPVDLKVTPAGSGYELSFYSDNRENGFSGYGVFTGTDKDSAETTPSDSVSTYFCPMKSTQVPYSERIKIMVGTPLSGDAICSLSSLTLTTGDYVSVRARAERDQNPWSLPVTVQVP